MTFLLLNEIRTFNLYCHFLSILVMDRYTVRVLITPCLRPLCYFHESTDSLVNVNA